MDTITLVIATIVIIILFIMLLFNVEIINFINNLSNTTNGTNTTPSDCPDYWVKYNNHKDSSSDTPKYGCYVNSNIQPSVLYNGGKCNYINGNRTNFGSMPNYCDVSQSIPSGSNLSISNPEHGIKLIDGWQSFFTDLKLAAVIAISPQQQQSWNPLFAGGTPSDTSANDHLELRHVGLYEFESRDDINGTITYTGTSADNLLTDSTAKSFSGKSYIMTGFDSLSMGGTILNENYGYTDSNINSSNGALDSDIKLFYKNAYKCGEEFEYDVDGSVSLTPIECPTTWSAMTSNLSVDTSYVLIYLDVSGNLDGANYSDSSNTQHVVSIYDKLTKSAIKKSVASSVTDPKKIKFKENNESTPYSYVNNLKIGGSSITDSTDLSNVRLNYLEFYIPPYNPNTISDNSNNTVAGYSMDVFDSLSYCQKRIWASKNDIQWSGITDNWSLDRCNEYDFSNVVDYTLDICFNISSGTANTCKYFSTSDASDAAAIWNGEGNDSLNRYGQTTSNISGNDGSNAQEGTYIELGYNKGLTCDIDYTSNYRSTIDFGNIL